MLSEKTGSDENFLYDGLVPKSIPVNAGILSDEFRDFLQMNQRAGKEPSVIFDVHSSNGRAFQRAGFKKN